MKPCVGVDEDITDDDAEWSDFNVLAEGDVVADYRRGMNISMLGVKEIFFQVSSLILAGVGGFEPPYGGTKNRCLTAWLHPKSLFFGCFFCGFFARNFDVFFDDPVFN